ncbi:hypothetical protein [Bacillus sp. CHD6a]|uniref:hypothetical protein n=1 Tax=Bacillus sp. CHD6a TaxID=1643452 RepID=UPI0006CC4646|nr:hypothetical protein [Bacillus sp. CHD6a]KPB06319.1 hypothetical protein AAV98_00490 [Bacillus sp. CHD6a]
MQKKQYYSERNGLVKEKYRISLREMRYYLDKIYNEYKPFGCFQKLFDEAGHDYSLFSIERFNKVHILPFKPEFNYQEDDIFDLIELFYEYIDVHSGKMVFNAPLNYGALKVDYQNDFRKKINRVLSKYDDGYYLTEEGEIRIGVTDGLDILVNTEITIDENNLDDVNNSNEVEKAKALFLHHKSSETDRRNALLILGRVLEENRKELKTEFMGKDESELFDLLNRFNIRHSDMKQKKGYPTGIYFDWIFYNLLSAIDAFYKIRTK